MSNPLLQQNYFPAFTEIKPTDVLPALKQIIDDNLKQINQLAKQQNPTWENFIYPLETLDDRLSRMWSPVSHMNSVINSDELQEVYSEALPLLSEYSNNVGQNQALYNAYQTLANSTQFSELDYAQQKAIDNSLRDFRLSGIALPAEQQEQFRDISQQLSQLGNQFQQNCLQATNAWSKLITDKNELAGIPATALASAAEEAANRGEQGWLLTLEAPCYLAVVTYADKRELREEIYQAYVTRASDQGPHAGQFDNTDVINQILKLRHDEAVLLGFKNYAELSLATKMADTPEQVLEFLTSLASKAHQQAKQEFSELCEFAKQQNGPTPLQPWDVAYYSEKLCQERYQIDQEQLRPYFPETSVIPGLFQLVEQLYQVSINELNNFPSWHKDVRCFEILDQNKQRIGVFYLDLYARSKKRGGAWMDDFIGRRMLDNGEIQAPGAYLVCNLTPPTKDTPALFTHDEVVTIFHEFGHGLHHMLTKINYLDVSGINGVAWDAVELPSQFMENFCWEQDVINKISKHYKTGEPLPEPMLTQMLKAKNFQSAMQMVRQLEFSLFDFRIHHEYNTETGIDVQAVLDNVRKQYAVIPIVEYNRFQHGFSHIFGGGYAAGYYSYKWAEVLSSDAYSKFEEDGVFNPEVGKSFLENILQQGGSKDAMECFVAFRGREPDIDALLRHSGISR